MGDSVYQNLPCRYPQVRSTPLFDSEPRLNLANRSPCPLAFERPLCELEVNSSPPRTCTRYVDNLSHHLKHDAFALDDAALLGDDCIAPVHATPAIYGPNTRIPGVPFPPLSLCRNRRIVHYA